jgi:hypothetical protein
MQMQQIGVKLKTETVEELKRRAAIERRTFGELCRIILEDGAKERGNDDR